MKRKKIRGILIARRARLLRDFFDAPQGDPKTLLAQQLHELETVARLLKLELK